MGRGRAAWTQSQLAPTCAESLLFARPISVRYVAMKETALHARSLLTRDAGVALHVILWSVTSCSMKNSTLSVKKLVAGRRIVADTVVVSAAVHCRNLAATRFLMAIGIRIFAQFPVANGCDVGTIPVSCYVIAAIVHHALRPSSLT